MFRNIVPAGTLSKYTGGQVYYYPGFQSTTQKDKLRHELARDLTRETAWEAVMRIRCGKGVCMFYAPSEIFFFNLPLADC